MSTKKTIQINPELFKLSGNKTKKNKEKKELSLNPIVTPNNLKNKLLNRIKQHKTNEINTKIKTNNNNTNNNNTNNNNTNNNNTNNNNTNNNDTNKYSNEFYGALDYLSDLTKKQKITEAKQRNLNTRTLKNYQTLSNNTISLDLPPELQETKTFVTQTNDVFNVNYKVANDVPYGCLKNGKKKTYREWKQLTSPTTTDIPDNIRPPTPPKKNLGMFLEGATNIGPTKSIDTTHKLSREERLEQIKNKLKQMQDQETQIKQQSLEDFKKIEKQYSNPLIGISKPLEDLNMFDITDTNDVEEMLQEREQQKESEKIKKYLKKTIKRKFTLGKSDKLRRVSILINDRQTRKNIINTQKELKKTTMTDVKQYLRQHGMIKVGSTCPADILRKTFETSILTGEVTNINKETLLHNYLLADKE